MLFDEIMSNFWFDKCCNPIVDAVVVLFYLEIVSSSVVRSGVFARLKYVINYDSRKPIGDPTGPEEAEDSESLEYLP